MGSCTQTPKSSFITQESQKISQKTKYRKGQKTVLNTESWKSNCDKILWTQSLKKQEQGSLRDGRKSENLALSKGQWQVAGRNSGNGGSVL